MQITIELSDELASKLSLHQAALPQILELEMREWNASFQPEFLGVAEVLEFLATLPTPEEIIALRPSETLQTQIQELLKKNRHQGLAADEQKLWEQYQYLEHLVRMAKAKAYLKLK